MTVLLPGMTEDDDRVKISSIDQHQQGLFDSWKSKVSDNFFFTLVNTYMQYRHYLWLAGSSNKIIKCGGVTINKLVFGTHHSCSCY